MKKHFKILILFFMISSCSAPGDCIKSTGDKVSKEIEVPEFDKIIVYNGISLVITQGENYKVVVNSGSNLIDDITIKVSDGMLLLEDETTCNWVRDYGQTTVYVTTPNLTEIYSKTEKSISSNGTLKFPNLKLVSMDIYDTYEGTGTGDFILEIENEKVFLETNNISHFTLSGKTNNIPLAVQRHLQILPQIFRIDLPEDLIAAVDKCKNNSDIRQVGVEWAIQQSKELKDAGIPVLHYYSMGKSENIKAIAKSIF